MSETLLLFSALLMLLLVFLLSVYRIISRVRKDREKARRGDDSQVGFVVETFHELVSKLKEKEKELELLRQKAEDRADVMESYNENILQSVPSGVISIGSNKVITKVNSTAERILEISAADAIGSMYDRVLRKPLAALLYGNEVISRAETYYTTDSGKRLYLGLTVTPLFDAKGDVIGRLLVFSDLSELKALEAQAELRSRLSSLGEMAAGIAHELRNPMGVIAGYTKMLSKKADPSVARIVDAISREIGVMDRIITDFLSFARPTKLALSEVDVAQIIRSAVENIAGGRGDISVVFDGSGEIHVQGDEVQLRQALTNLVQNAVEAMPQGGELKITLQEFPEYLDIRVSDTGHGIPEKMRDKIFLPFYTTKDKGTGLGLAVVHKIVVSHQGSISAQSSEKGTVFAMKLPLRLKDE